MNGVAIEPIGDGLEQHWDVIVHNGLTGNDREETIVATGENEQEAELVAVGLRALLRTRRTLASWIAGRAEMSRQ